PRYLLLILRPPPCPTLFPYTTLFRSIDLDRRIGPQDILIAFLLHQLIDDARGVDLLAAAAQEADQAHALLGGFFLDVAHFADAEDRKSTRLNSSHVKISYAVFCLKKK